MVNYLRYTNDQFWYVLEFSFIEGKPYNKQQIDNAEKTAVITQDLRKAYFGDEGTAVGKYIETDNVQYRITGVVKNPPFASNVYSDIYVPYTLAKDNINQAGLMGGYTAIMLLNSTGDVGKARDEYDQMVAKLPRNDKDKEFDQIYTFADSYFRTFIRSLHLSEGTNSGMGIFLSIAGIVVLLFLLLPTLYLVNINISRIMERSSEIGVRKAFGASSRALVYQFIVENLILTFLGGIFGVLLSYIAIQIANTSNAIPNMHLSISFNVLFVTMLACMVFGLLSGVYPAWRMSRLQVVSALKAQ